MGNSFWQTENFPQDLLRRNLLNFNDLLVDQKFGRSFTTAACEWGRGEGGNFKLKTCGDGRRTDSHCPDTAQHTPEEKFLSQFHNNVFLIGLITVEAFKLAAPSYPTSLF
jgi:hypothetical protein